MKCITMCSTLELAAEVTEELARSARGAALYHMLEFVVRCAWFFFFFFFSFFPQHCLKLLRKKNRRGQKEGKVGEILLTTVISTCSKSLIISDENGDVSCVIDI